jgi:hypothetical protein
MCSGSDYITPMFILGLQRERQQTVNFKRIFVTLDFNIFFVLMIYIDIQKYYEHFIFSDDFFAEIVDSQLKSILYYLILKLSFSSLSCS